jgi:hypothetical protein
MSERRDVPEGDDAADDAEAREIAERWLCRMVAEGEAAQRNAAREVGADGGPAKGGQQKKSGGRPTAAAARKRNQRDGLMGEL